MMKQHFKILLTASLLLTAACQPSGPPAYGGEFPNGTCVSHKVNPNAIGIVVRVFRSGQISIRWEDSLYEGARMHYPHEVIAVSCPRR